MTIICELATWKALNKSCPLQFTETWNSSDLLDTSKHLITVLYCRPLVFFLFSPSTKPFKVMFLFKIMLILIFVPVKRPCYSKGHEWFILIHSSTGRATVQFIHFLFDIHIISFFNWENLPPLLNFSTDRSAVFPLCGQCLKQMVHVSVACWMHAGGCLLMSESFHLSSLFLVP